jgi:hypothetical protein
MTQARRGFRGLTGTVLAGILIALAAAPVAARADDPLPQRELNYGYAGLYGAARGLRHSAKIFLIKFESEAVESVVQDLSETMAGIVDELERLDAADPELSLDDEGLPEVERRKRDAVTRDRLLSFRPITGRTGASFERTLLLSESGALNQLQFLVEELDQADPDPRRSAVLRKIHGRITRQYAQVVALLDREYFK